MIFYASQRANAAELARHLLNTHENDHVTVHEVRGFATHDLTEALWEVMAISRGTRCKQFLFAVSLNPPEEADVPIADFETAIEQMERKLNLSGQPRIIVFHEKKGRRNCHVVWSRLTVSRHTLGRMIAIPMNHFKRKLQELSYALFLRHGWQLPAGMRHKADKNPFALTREEYRQAVRLMEDATVLKGLFKALWEQSDSKAAFVTALEAHGFLLAQGDRRGFVAVDLNGKIYSLSRWLAIKGKDLKARLGAPEDLPTTEQAKSFLYDRMTENLRRYEQSVKKQAAQKRQPLVRELRELVRQQRMERQELIDKQNTRRRTETRIRISRFATGISGLWERATGEHARKCQMNRQEAKSCHARDNKEFHTLIRAQLKERQALEQTLRFYRTEEQQARLRLRREMAQYVSTATAPFMPLKPEISAPDKPPLAAQIEQLETKIALLSGDVHQLQASLESNLLSEEMRARIRRMIERTLETLHIKAIEEKQQLTRTEERQKEVERKQVELNQYIRHYAELQHKQEELHRKQNANRQFYAVVTHMSYSLNGLPRWDIRVQSPPPEKRLDEKAYVANIQQLKNRELLHTITTTERPKPVIEPETAAPNLRQSVLEAKEILRRAGLQPGGDDRRTVAPARNRITDTTALSTRFTQRRP
ncbi:MAG: hypothetical protein Q8K65_03470 [Alphaproteobacteria bacterium]|nr:hypothetical protein [Alphaproteobacteria bacterium]